MRSRSHRMASSDPKDDWVDGSWTVDCVCGVNYDDGEEMVDCDECGVWVHTRCSRYVKSDKSFACDKCKNRNNRNDSEETEVAQLLVELPTKTMRMESSYNQRLSSDPRPPRRPFKLWTEKPMEDRVHIQGIPGGDPALFAGKSSIFSPALWKAAGYVPKKFNFQYREFPCWDRNEDTSPNVEHESESPIDKGANVLFSFSKENASNTLVGMKERGERGNDDRELGSKVGQKYDGENLDIRHAPKATSKSRRPFAIHSNKKKEDFRTLKERNGKKRASDHEENTNIKNKAVKPTSDAKEFKLREDKVAKFSKNDSQSILISNSAHTMSHQALSVENGLAENNMENLKNNIVDHSSQAFNCDISRHGCVNGAVRKEQQDGSKVLESAETSSISKNSAPRVGSNYAGTVLLRVEGVRMDADNLDSIGEDLSTNAVFESQKQHDAVAAPKPEGSLIVENSNDSILQRPEQPKVKVETEADHSNSIANMKQSSPLLNEKSECPNNFVQYTRLSSNHVAESSKVDGSMVNISKSIDDKAQNVERSSEVVSGHTDDMKELSDEPYLPNQDVNIMDGCNVLLKSSSKPKDDCREVDGQLKSGEIVPRPHTSVSSQRRMVVCVGKSSSMSSANLISKSSVCDDGNKINSRASDPIMNQRISSGGSIKLDDVTRVTVTEENEMSRKYAKELPKSSVGFTLKTLHSGKSLQSSAPKHMVSESKEPVVYTSSRASSRQNATVTISSGEAVEPSQTQNASFGQNKITSSGSSLKGDKTIQSSGQSSSKVNLTRATNPPASSNSPATLSDEELALLLHQELNSSPRVPRVPRVRQVGSLPQLGSPTATSMLKRTSSFGGKDHSSMFRRKVKDAKDGSLGVHEVDYAAKKKERVPSSPSRRRQTSGDVADASTRKKVVNGSPEAINMVRKNIRSTSSEATNSVPSSSEATGQNSSSTRNSPSNIFDDVTSVGRSPVQRTLPGLINEIMSKGKRMTYEELCNAVLPHWNNLRKHNGERYAYASHFQAVLDCLRNRTEWAQLVDRGPKTNAGRKRRKIDPEEQLSFESEDKHSKGRTEREVESKNLELHCEDVPKGKRKARKRRLALQGRGIKDVRKKRKVDVASDDDDETSHSSKSSEECLNSDDEIQGGETCPAETEDSGNSD